MSEPKNNGVSIRLRDATARTSNDKTRQVRADLVHQSPRFFSQMIMDFESRAQLAEMMDESCSYVDFRACLQDLEKVNRLTFAYHPTLQWLQKVLPRDGRATHIVDVGCGGGDMLRQIERWAKRQGIAVLLTGIDLNPYAARAAREMTSASSAIEWRTGDAFTYRPAVPIDLVISSLFTHHLPDSEVIRFIEWMEQVANVGWFVNDLHRQRLPYFGFKLLAKMMRWHPFIQYDGPVSIRRAFRHADWRGYLDRAAVSRDDVNVMTIRLARLCMAREKPRSKASQFYPGG